MSPLLFYNQDHSSVKVNKDFWSYKLEKQRLLVEIYMNTQTSFS